MRSTSAALLDGHFAPIALACCRADYFFTEGRCDVTRMLT